ncbi:interleukin-12 subunit alpha [Anguilla rostrata]|uniref:interleukin-12 subunit alpha n=1 Tax=Anguilla rostrata TaxID=7938 RepID=UPI0030D45405
MKNVGFLSWLLLAALSPYVWRVTLGTPLKPAQKLDVQCVTLSRALLTDVTRALARDELFEGFNCTEQSMAVNTALSACEPSAGQDGGCSSTQSIRFNKDECLRNIKVDLEYHQDKLFAYQRKDLEDTVLTAIQNLLKKCDFPSGSWPSSAVTTPSSPQPSRSSFDFDARLSLCRELKGFQVRSVTINRIMGYMAA